MKFEVDWTQASTKRGLVWAIGSVAALVYLFYSGDSGGFSAIIGSTGVVAGGLGVAIKD